MGPGLVLLLLAIGLFWLALRLRRRTGIPWVRVAASDTGGFQSLERPLFAPRYELTGKPDYLLLYRGRYVPVEVKPTRRATQPYASDLFQLVAYCLLVEETTGQAPTHGLLRYADMTFRVDYTPAARADLLTILAAMRADLEAADCVRSHDEPHRCAGCGFLAVCDEALVDELA